MPMAGRFKSYFLRGLAVLLPTTLTIGIFVWGYTFIQENISIHINKGLVLLICRVKGVATDSVYGETLTDNIVKGNGSVVGFLLALIAVCIVGAILASVVGRTLYGLR